MGGMGLDTAPQALVRVYEAAKDRWQPLTSMPTPRYGATPFIRGKQVFLMGTNLVFLRLRERITRTSSGAPPGWSTQRVRSASSGRVLRNASVR